MSEAAMRAPGMDAAPPSQPDRTEVPRGQLITGSFRRIRRRRRTVLTSEPEPETPHPVRRPARIAVLLATAHRLQEALDRGDISDRAELARRLGVTRARVTQVLNLTLLAPDIQEALLFAEAVDGVEPVSERGLRGLAGLDAWAEQRKRWSGLRTGPLFQTTPQAPARTRGVGDAD